MSLVQEISDGQVLSDKTAGTASASSSSSSDSTKDMFLKLLVTEMQYQDPLEPSDNSQYVQELATFSQVEALNNVSSNMSQMQASSLVGNYVTIKSDEEGADISGYVDYVTLDGSDLKVSIDGNLYDVNDVSSVQDSDFYEAGILADTFTSLMAKLPSVNDVTLADRDDVASAYTVYSQLNDYQKSFIDQSVVSKLESLVNRITALSSDET